MRSDDVKFGNSLFSFITEFSPSKFIFKYLLENIKICKSMKVHGVLFG
jgi:hypothetical protein